MAKYVIIGGVAGGATTAARLRRLDEDSEIILFEKDENISYANCGLPYYIGGVIKHRASLLVQTPAGFRQRFNIDVRTRNEIVKINRDNKTLEVKNLDTDKTYNESYDKLLLSPGAAPVKPPLPGIDDPTIFTLRNVKDTDRIKSFIDDNNPKKAVIIGGGFIGLEMAENLHSNGISVTIVEMANQVLAPLDFEMAAEVHHHLAYKNVKLYLNDAVDSFNKKNNNLIIKLKNGKDLEADFAILSIGVRPENSLARDAGLDIGEKSGIIVNEHLQTSDPNIYAVGDAIEFINPIIKKSLTTFLAGPANKQARIAADNIVKNNTRKYKGSIATAIAKIFDLTVASCGISEKILQSEKIKCISSITHSFSHAGYYPDSKPISIKIIFDPDNGKLFGAQVVGYDGADKRIDMIATVLKNRGDIYDLEEIEHAYAPPFSSAKDPVNIAGFVAENIISKITSIVHWHELDAMDLSNIFLIDVRTPGEYRQGTINGAVNIEIDMLRERLNEIPKDKKIVVFCAVGVRAYLATRILKQKGYKDVFNLSGGYKTYMTVTQKI